MFRVPFVEGSAGGRQVHDTLVRQLKRGDRSDDRAKATGVAKYASLYDINQQFKTKGR